jgi:hypothetical protein
MGLPYFRLVHREFFARVRYDTRHIVEVLTYDFFLGHYCLPECSSPYTFVVGGLARYCALPQPAALARD